MSKIHISTLSKINQALAENKVLESRLNQAEDELKTLAQNYNNEEENFAIITKEKKVTELLLGIQARNLLENRNKENKTKIKLGQIIDGGISDYLTEKNFNQLIKDIIASNPGKKYTLEADPDLAKKLGISDYKKAETGQLRINFEFNSYILDPESLYTSLRPRLLTKILN